jgi:glycosyltransferase involved in cell wall biosynthesis
MRILYVVHDFFPRYYGGTERYVLNLAHQMQQMGHRTDVLTYGLGEPDGALPETVGAMPARSYVHEGLSVLALRHRSEPPALSHQVADDEVAEAVDLVLDRTRYDIVHVAHPMRLAASSRAVRRRRVPLVLTLTDFWLLCPRTRCYKPDHSHCNSPERGEKCMLECGFGPEIRERYRQAQQLFVEADAVIAPSDLLVDVFRQCDWQRAITKIHHGVSYLPGPVRPAQQLANRKLRVGYTGVVARFKGADHLVRAFTAAAAPNLTLKIYGSIIWDNELRWDLEVGYGTNANIQLVNRYEHDELPHVMADLDLTVVPSTTLESFGLVVVESLAHGVPVIASDLVGAARELIRHGHNGLIYPAGNDAELRALFEKVSRDPELVARLREGIEPPPRIEEEAFRVERVYRSVLKS